MSRTHFHSNAAQPHPLDQRGQELQVKKYVSVGGNTGKLVSSVFEYVLCWYILCVRSFVHPPDLKGFALHGLMHNQSYKVSKGSK